MDSQPQAVDGNDLSSASLPALLKCHNENDVVIGFDTELLSKKCTRTSPDFLSHIDLDELVQDIFPVGEY